MEWIVVQKLGLALGLGLLVGFQREWTAPHVAGLRTFALITLFGTVIGLFESGTNAWLISAGLLSIAAMLIVGNLLKLEYEQERDEPGLTTQVAALVMYLVGAAIALDRSAIAIIVAGGTAVLLHWKGPLHQMIRRFGKEDVRAIIQLVLISLVILPILPNEDYGPYGVLNPFEIWMVVVLIVGISLAGYIALKFLGTNAGMFLGGILGGVISSTATTVSYSRLAWKVPASSAMATLVIMIASTIVFGRVLIEVSVVSPSIVSAVAPPIIALASWMALICLVLFFFIGSQEGGSEEDLLSKKDPSEFKSAIIFGLLYAVVLFAVAAVKENFGNNAMYAVAAVSGLTEMDAITISTAQMISREELDVDTGWRMILIGAMSNIAFKGAVVCTLGHRRLLKRIVITFGLSLVGGALLLAFWP